MLFNPNVGLKEKQKQSVRWDKRSIEDLSSCDLWNKNRFAKCIVRFLLGTRQSCKFAYILYANFRSYHKLSWRKLLVLWQKSLNCFKNSIQLCVEFQPWTLSLLVMCSHLLLSQWMLIICSTYAVFKSPLSYGSTNNANFLILPGRAHYSFQCHSLLYSLFSLLCTLDSALMYVPVFSMAGPRLQNKLSLDSKQVHSLTTVQLIVPEDWQKKKKKTSIVVSTSLP